MLILLFNLKNIDLFIFLFSRHHLSTRRQLPNGVQDDAQRVPNAGIWLYQLFIANIKFFQCKYSLKNNYIQLCMTYNDQNLHLVRCAPRARLIMIKLTFSKNQLGYIQSFNNFLL